MPFFDRHNCRFCLLNLVVFGTMERRHQSKLDKVWTKVAIPVSARLSSKISFWPASVLL